MAQYPEIDYNHVLSELSVNRKDPCEVIRELISNSYDANASRIEIFSLLKEKGFIYFDDGIGLCETTKINGITPYKAFFSIGRSTKIQGELIGYKCQGSKLCFASKKITLITRCSNESSWRSISIDNPKDNLNQKYDIQANSDSTPWLTLNNVVQSNAQTKRIINYLNEDFFNRFKSATMIIVQGLEVEKFSDFYNTDENGITSWSYLKHYIRFNTRHGDMRILQSDKTDFPASKAENLKQSPGYNEQTKLYLWSNNQLKKIEPGYPYLEKPDELDKLQIKSPAKVSRLNDGRFSYRGAARFEFEGITYCLALAIDGNRRALIKYEELGRQGSKRSGISLHSQRGAFICSEGVKICSYNEIFEHSKLDEYAVMGTPNGQSHYILMINGSFDVVTNRNSLTEAAIRILNDDQFIDKIKQFFDAAKKNVGGFRELIERLNKDNQDAKLDAYTKKLNTLKDRIQDRPRFMVQDIDHLKGKWLVEPSVGEESWVGALYTMFAHLVCTDSPYAHLWLRPRTFSSMGIDSIAVNIDENSLAENVHKALEYKYAFYPNDEFNHPLILTCQIVCWEMPTPDEGEQIEDSYNHYGYTSLSEELNEIGYEIIKIQSRDGDFHGGNIKVISLKRLLDKTWRCQWETPPPKATTSKKRKGGRKLK